MLRFGPARLPRSVTGDVAAPGLGRLRQWLRTLCVAAALLAAAGTANATVVYDNGPFTGGNGNNIASFLYGSFNIAGGATVDGAVIYIDGYNYFNGTINYQITSDVGGYPGSVLASGTATGLTGVYLGNPQNYGYRDYYQVAFDFTSVFTAVAGTTYFFGIQNGNSNIAWGYVSPATTVQPGDSAGQHGFQLTGDPIPEPLSLAVLGTAVAAMSLVRRRRRS